MSPLIKEGSVFAINLSTPPSALLSILFCLYSNIFLSFSAKFFNILCFLSCFYMVDFGILGFRSRWCYYLGACKSYIHGTPLILNCFRISAWYLFEICSYVIGWPGMTLFIAFCMFLTYSNLVQVITSKIIN